MVDQRQEFQPLQEKISDLTSEHIALKTNFMANSLPAQEFLTKLFDLDQQDLTRKAAAGNIELLEDPQIMEKINATGEAELIHQALDDKSFFRFHQGQNLAFSGDLKAAQTLQQARTDKLIARGFLENLKKDDRFKQHETQIQQILDTTKPFALYMEATAAYMNGQLGIVEDIFQQLQQTDSQHINTKIVERFIAGLKKRNAPNYKEDYQPLTFSKSL